MITLNKVFPILLRIYGIVQLIIIFLFGYALYDYAQDMSLNAKLSNSTHITVIALNITVFVMLCMFISTLIGIIKIRKWLIIIPLVIIIITGAIGFWSMVDPVTQN
jgi:hypothetical protein